MAELVEVAIQKALVDRAIAFAATQSPAITISLPNVAFATPTETQTSKWLRVTFLPAPSTELGISFASTIQHYGILQIDVFHSRGAGEYAPGRIASAVMAYFARGTLVTQDGFKALVIKQPYRGSIITDDPWVMIPVSIPYIAVCSVIGGADTTLFVVQRDGVSVTQVNNTQIENRRP